MPDPLTAAANMVHLNVDVEARVLHEARKCVDGLTLAARFVPELASLVTPLKTLVDALDDTVQSSPVSPQITP